MNGIPAWTRTMAFLLLLLGGPAWATAQADNARNNPLEGDMVLIPAGSFVFGTDAVDSQGEALAIGIPKPWYIDETPQQKVFLKQFYLDRYEVTNERYKIFVDDLGAVYPEHWKDGAYPEGEGQFPVVGVTWFDAANFCNWAGKTLPTEKQWERAARGTEGNLYPWGNEFGVDRANLADNPRSKNTLKAVGSFPTGQSAEGVFDLIGNAWEWTESDYQPYKDSKYESPYFGQGLKVARGQSAMNIGHYPEALYSKALAKFARAGYREFLNPDDNGSDISFRCASPNKVPAMKKAALGTQSGSSGNPFGGASGGEAGGSKPAESASAPSIDFNPFEAKPNLPQSGILVLMMISFAAGVFSFLSPCTLPILPAYFAVTAQADRTRMSMMSVAFFIGLATLFVIMGASASALGQFLRDYLFQVTTAGGVLVAIFGVMTLFGKGFSGAHFQQKPAGTFFGFFLFGATFALGWTPCVGPILSGILILAASDKTIFQGMGLLFFYAVGLGFPLILISTFCGKLSKDGLFWRILRGKGWEVNIGGKTLLLHTTNIFSGLLLIALGVILATGYMTYINNLVPLEIQIWFSEYEEKFLKLFM